MDNVQIVVGFAELTAVQEHLGDLFDGDILVGLVQPTVEGTTGDNEIFAVLHRTLDGVQISPIDMPGGNEQIAVFASHGLFPKEVAVRLIAESLMEGHSRCQHIHIVGLIDDILVKGVFVDQGRSQFVKAVTAAALPILGLSDAAGILAGDHLVQPDFTVCVGVVAHFNTDIPPPHLVGDGGGSAGAKEGVEDEITRVGGNM